MISLPDDDPLIDVSLHESTVRLLRELLPALADLTEPGAERLTPDVRSYLMQALDNAADLDLLSDVLADALEEAVSGAGTI